MSVSVGVLTAKLTLDNAEFNRGMDDSMQRTKSFGEMLGGLNFRQIGMEMAGVGAVLTGVFGGAMVGAIKAASDLNESMSKSEVVFGASAKAIADWSQTSATAMGLSRQAALESAATFGNLFTAMGMTKPAAADMSRNLVQLAADLASFNNQRPEDMLMKLRSGLVGEIEPLRSVGVQMNEATVQAKAMEMGLGKTKNQISEADKVLARYAIILEQTKTAQGDFGRTADGVANQMRIMQARTDDLMASFGTGLLPAVSGAMQVLNGLLSLLTAMPDELKNMTLAVVGVTAAIGAAMVAVGAMVALLGGPFTLAIVAITAVIAGLTAIVALEWQRILKIFDTGSLGVKTSLRDVAGYLGVAADYFAIFAIKVVGLLDEVVTGAKNMVTAIGTAFTALKVTLGGVLAALVSGDMKEFAKALLTAGEVGAQGLAKIQMASSQLKVRLGEDAAAIQTHYAGQFKAAFEKAADSVSTAAGKIDTDLSKLKDQLNNTANAAKAHGKAHEDAATKAARAWSVARIQMQMDLNTIGEFHQKVMDKIVADRKKADEDYLKQQLMWGRDSLKIIQQATKDRIEMESAFYKQRLNLANATNALFEEAEHVYAKNLIENIKKTGKDLKEIMQRDWGEGLGQIALAIGHMTNASTKDIAKWSGDISGIVQSMPGKFGQAARGVLKTVDDWATFANRILKMMHDMNSKVPDSLGGLISSVVGVFQKMFHAVSGTQEKGQQQSIDSANKWAARIMAVIGGITTFMSTRGQGKLTGVLGGAMAGAQIGGLFGPIGAGIGAGIGAIAGLFHSGKSAAQKQEEERQKKQMAMDMEKQAIDITSAAIDSMHKALDMFKALADHVDVPRAAIKSFFATLEKVTKEFLSLAGKFAKDNMEAAKTFAESLSPVVDLMGGALEVFTALKFYTGIPEKAITSMATDLGRAADAMGQVALDIEQQMVKKAMKFSKAVQFIVDLIGSAVEAFTSLQQYQGVPAYVMGWLVQDIQTAVDLMGQIADDTSRNFLNKAKTYAERISVIVKGIADSVAAFTTLQTYQGIPQAAFDAFEHDMMAAFAVIDRLATAGEQYMDRAIDFQELMERIAAALSAGASALSSIGGSSISGGVTVAPGGLESLRSSRGSASAPQGGLVINGMQFSGMDPKAQRVIDSVQDLLGTGGLPLAARAY